MDDSDHLLRIVGEAGSLLSDDPSDKPAHIINLAVTFQRLFERTGSERYLDTAVALIEGTLSALPEDHPYRPTCFNNLGTFLRSRYDCTQSMDDLKQAIDAGHKALEVSRQITRRELASF